MERGEPTFVPEWLKGTTGNLNGGGSSTHHYTSTSSHSDDHGVAHPSRNRSSLSFSDYDSSRSSVLLDRTTSSYFRRSSSSNGSMLYEKDISSNSRSYSFNRSHRDRREKERSMSGDYRVCDSSDITTLTNRFEEDILRRSQSMISGNRGDAFTRRAVPELNGNHSHNGVRISNICSIGKTMFERDFPHLGAEERQEIPDRASSPCLATAVQSLPMGVVGNGWTSALAEVPAIVGHNNNGPSSVPQIASASSATSTPSTTTGLNMAETLAQAPSRARTAPQVSVESQRLAELAIKQSRQLIPMTPSMPKNLVPTSEKQKPKSGGRSDTSVANKTGQQQLSSSHLVNLSLHGSPTKSDVAKMSHGGKLLVLKTPRENGTWPVTKDSSKSTNSGRKASNQPVVTPPAPNNLASAERKAPALPANFTSSMERKPTISQAKSRNDFFNLMRKKTSTSVSSAGAVPSSVTASVLKESGEVPSEPAALSPQGSDAPVSDPSRLDWSTDFGTDSPSNGGRTPRYQNSGEKHSSSDAILYPDEEEAAFLRSLGWEENAGEEGLTEEEINAFYLEYVKLRPSSMRQPKLSVLCDSHVGVFGDGSRKTSSDFFSEA